MRRTIPIYKALNKSHMILGGERNLVLMTGLISFTLIFAALSLETLILGLIFWFTGLFLLRKMGRADPMLSRVYLKHLRYRSFYPAFSRPARRD